MKEEEQCGKSVTQTSTGLISAANSATKRTCCDKAPNLERKEEEGERDRKKKGILK
jgi:hypothetical protein